MSKERTINQEYINNIILQALKFDKIIIYRSQPKIRIYLKYFLKRKKRHM